MKIPEKKILVVVLDGVGAGELPDAKEYGDVGSNTLTNLAEKVGGLQVPNLEKLGFGNIVPMRGVMALEKPAGSWGRLAERSPGKDSTTGHWEIAGLQIDFSFPTYPQGFPPSIIAKFKSATGKEVLGNKPASGTEIIRELGEEHLKTGAPIIYTSADSVFQIAAHEDVIPLQDLYEICRNARSILDGADRVGRVIARPFTGKPGAFERTRNRKDFAVPPPGKTILNILQENEIPTVGIGKIDDLFSGIGLSEKIHSKSNAQGIDLTIEWCKKLAAGFIFTNLVDFDMLWGHRNDAKGFAGGLEYFDSRIPELLDSLNRDDLVLFTSDHGNDPTDISTDHTREYIPLLVFGKKTKNGVNLGNRETLADIAATIADFFNIPKTRWGKSFLPEINP